MLTCDRLRELLDFDPETGVFTQRIVYEGQRARWKAGRVSGSVSKQTGYLTLRLDGKLYQAHRAAWMHHFGVWPQDDIDHLNGQRTDNRIANLRDVDNTINRQNQKRARADSATGVQGVAPYKDSGRFQARVRHEGISHYLGTYDTVEAARSAYVEAKARLHPGWVPPEDVGPSVEADVPPAGCKRVRCDSKSGLQGVQATGDKWRARLGSKHLGMFDTAEAAHAAFLIAKSE